MSNTRSALCGSVEVDPSGQLHQHEEQARMDRDDGRDRAAFIAGLQVVRYIRSRSTPLHQDGFGQPTFFRESDRQRRHLPAPMSNRSSIDSISTCTADSLANPPRTRQRSTSTRRNASYTPRSGRVGLVQNCRYAPDG